MAGRLLFIVNLLSGRSQIRYVLGDVLDTFVKAGWETEVYITQSAGDARETTRLRAPDFDRIVTSGGDGTLDEVVQGLMQSQALLPIGYLPAGSTNDFAGSLGLPKDLLEAAAIAAAGSPVSVDVGRFNDTHFVYVAAFGLFTEVSYGTSQEMKNLLGHAAYILEGMRKLGDVRAFSMTVSFDGQDVVDDFIYGMVTNARSVGGFSGLIAPPVDLSDGLFEVTLIRFPRTPLDWNEIIAVLTGSRESSEKVITFQTDSLTFFSEEEVPWTLDGEFGGSHCRVAVQNLSHAVTMLVPAT